MLRHLNRLLSDTSDVTASALVGCYRPAGRTLTWSQAGHPPPLLAHAGTAGPLPRPKGMLLGARPDSSYATASITLAPDDVLLLYTDGLIEHRTGLDLDDGVRHLATAFTKALASPASASQLDDVIAGLRQANPDDDTCILAARPSTATTPSHPPSRPG